MWVTFGLNPIYATNTLSLQEKCQQWSAEVERWQGGLPWTQRWLPSWKYDHHGHDYHDHHGSLWRKITQYSWLNSFRFGWFCRTRPCIRFESIQVCANRCLFHFLLWISSIYKYWPCQDKGQGWCGSRRWKRWLECKPLQLLSAPKRYLVVVNLIASQLGYWQWCFEYIICINTSQQTDILVWGCHREYCVALEQGKEVALSWRREIHDYCECSFLHQKASKLLLVLSSSRPYRAREVRWRGSQSDREDLVGFLGGNKNKNVWRGACPPHLTVIVSFVPILVTCGLKNL